METRGSPVIQCLACGRARSITGDWLNALRRRLDRTIEPEQVVLELRGKLICQGCGSRLCASKADLSAGEVPPPPTPRPAFPDPAPRRALICDGCGVILSASYGDNLCIKCLTH